MRLDLEDIPVPAVFAEHRIIRACNTAFADLFGYPRAEVVGSSFRRLYPDVGDFVRVGEQWHTHLGTGGAYTDERVMLRKDGTKLWCRVNGRSQTPADPLAAVLYCFETMRRAVSPGERELTGRQRQVLMLMARGLTNAGIANELDLSTRTIEAHRARLMKVMGLRNGAALMAWFNEREP